MNSLEYASQLNVNYNKWNLDLLQVLLSTFYDEDFCQYLNRFEGFPLQRELLHNTEQSRGDENQWMKV